jgi:hypothetical protein
MFKVLLLISGVILMWLGVGATSDLWTYYRLEETAPIISARWKVVEISSSEFGLKAFYQFEKGVGKTVLQKPYYLNRFSAEKAAQEMLEKEWNVWYDPKDPSFNALEKQIPYKKIVYLLMAAGVSLFFALKIQSSRQLKEST